MAWRLTTFYPEYLYQLAALLRDPVYQGRDTPKGQGQSVLLIPGFLAGDWTLGIMAGWLDRIGYRTYFSGIDWNIDCPNKTGEKLQWRLEHIAKETGSPLTVIGHSLGGLLARFLGANFPEHVHQVVALGSPLDVSNPVSVHPLVRSAFHLLAPLRRLRGPTFRRCGSMDCSCHFAKTAFSLLPPTVSFTSIFSKNDEVVDWRASVDPQGTNIEVTGRHIGLIVNREVYQAVAESLAGNAMEDQFSNSAKPLAL
ncbi:MAG: esterase/lipase family protein [Candidatus Binatia bacterium]